MFTLSLPKIIFPNSRFLNYRLPEFPIFRINNFANAQFSQIIRFIFIFILIEFSLFIFPPPLLVPQFPENLFSRIAVFWTPSCPNFEFSEFPVFPNYKFSDLPDFGKIVIWVDGCTENINSGNWEFWKLGFQKIGNLENREFEKIWIRENFNSGKWFSWNWRIRL